MWVLNEGQSPESPQASPEGPSDIVLARRLMYFIHQLMVRQGSNEVDPGPSSA